MENSDLKKKLDDIFHHKGKKRLSIDDILNTFVDFDINKDKDELGIEEIPKREQIKNACVNCKMAHKKCDPNRPCNRCSEYNIPEKCKDSIRKPRKKNNEIEKE